MSAIRSRAHALYNAQMTCALVLARLLVFTDASVFICLRACVLCAFCLGACSAPVATLGTLLTTIARSYPHLGPFLPVCAVARNREYLDAGADVLRTVLAPGDQISIMPPVSGG